MIRPVVRLAVCVLVAGVLAGGCTSSEPSGDSAGQRSDCVAAEPQQLAPVVVATTAHDPDAYSQGLLLIDGTLYESTGLEGESTVREVDPATGDVLASEELPPEVFGEGLAQRGDDQLVQLTWKDEVAYVWDRDTLQLEQRFSYEGEGWGLTTLDDGTFVMSDGSDSLTLRDPSDFSVMSEFAVTRVGGPTDLLNELEWDGRTLWANRYRSAELLGIDMDCGAVESVVDLSGLWDDATSRATVAGTEIDVPNGVAHIADTDRYLVTGKLWPVTYEVRFEPA